MHNWIKETYRMLRYRQFLLRRALKDGMLVGKNTKFVGRQEFGTEPYLIEIGENCLITNGVKFINHDGGIQVPLIYSGRSIYKVYGNYSTFGKIKIGNNVFIGVNAIILPNTEIGDNCIIGSGSIVSGSFKSGTVIAGIPGKVICSTEEYWEKNKHKVLDLTDLKGEQRKKEILRMINANIS